MHNSTRETLSNRNQKASPASKDATVLLLCMGAMTNHYMQKTKYKSASMIGLRMAVPTGRMAGNCKIITCLHTSTTWYVQRVQYSKAAQPQTSTMQDHWLLLLWAGA